MDYELIRPFGPTIYRSTMSSELMTLLHKCATWTRDVKENVGSDLAGNIDDQLQAIMDPDQQQEFMKLVSKHLATYMQTDWDHRQTHMINPSPETPDFASITVFYGNDVYIIKIGRCGDYSIHRNFLFKSCIGRI